MCRLPQEGIDLFGVTFEVPLPIISPPPPSGFTLGCFIELFGLCVSHKAGLWGRNFFGIPKQS